MIGVRGQVVIWISLAAAAGGRASDKDAEVDRAVQVAADLLVSWQETYAADPSVGRFSDKELSKWQAQEKKRLASLREQGGDEWPYEGVYRVGGDSHIPFGYRVGGTAIVCEALILAPGFAQMDDRRKAVDRGLAFIVRQLETNDELSRGPKTGYDVRGWAHTYGLRILLLARKHKLLGDLAARADLLIPDLIDRLAANETPQGGWNYANNSISPFMTGPTLLTLFEAQQQGFAVDAGLIARALDGLEKGRTSSGSFAYSSAARGKVDMPGSAARAAVAELALFHAGRSDTKRLHTAVEGFFDGWSELLKRKSQQGTHEGAHGIAPYYFFFGHTYAALAIEYLPEKDRPALRKKLFQVLWKTREHDGSWNDRVFPRSASYSTAMVALALLAPTLDPIPAWTATAAKQPDAPTTPPVRKG